MLLVWATPRANFAVFGAQLWSTMTAIFPCVNNFACMGYLQPRFRYYCQIFKTTGLFLLKTGLFPFSLSEMLWGTCTPSICSKIRTWRFHRTEEVSNNFPVNWHITRISMTISAQRWQRWSSGTRYRPQFYKVGLLPFPRAWRFSAFNFDFVGAR